VIARASYMRLHVHILLSRMELSNKKIDTYWRQYGQLWELLICPNDSGLMASAHLFIFSTACHPKYLIFTHHYKLWNGMLHNSDTHITCGKPGLAFTSVWCKECISSWRSKRGSIHGCSPWFYWKNKKYGVQAYKITLWTETVSQGMVWKIQSSNAEA